MKNNIVEFPTSNVIHFPLNKKEENLDNRIDFIQARKNRTKVSLLNKLDDNFLELILKKNVGEEIEEDVFRSLAKMTSYTFHLEGCNRVATTLLCEMGFSYVQQSQRYVDMTKDGYTLGQLKGSRYQKEIEEVIEKSFDLYKRMTKLTKEGKGKKGRPTVEDYEHGIPIEDARYILPLACKSNIVMTLTGERLIELFALMNDFEYAYLFENIKEQIVNSLPPYICDAIEAFSAYHTREYDSDVFNLLVPESIDRTQSVALLNAYEEPELSVGLSASVSSSNLGVIETLEKWGESQEGRQEKAKGLTKRVLSYGHTSINEHFKTSCIMKMSLVTYHQFIRHRMSDNIRESFSALAYLDSAKEGDPTFVVPESIHNSKFKDEYISLVNEIRELRYGLFLYADYEVPFELLLNCEKISVINNSNARADIDVMKERLCLNAQWEIRNLYFEKLKILKSISGTVYADAKPSCLRGGCTEGALSCGKPELIREILGECR